MSGPVQEVNKTAELPIARITLSCDRVEASPQTEEPDLRISGRAPETVGLLLTSQPKAYNRERVSSAFLVLGVWT